jgi:hypothetical protein
LALRARIVLGCAAGLNNKAVAARERVTAQTVGKWRRRFVERGLDALLADKQIKRGVHRSVDQFKADIALPSFKLTMTASHSSGPRQPMPSSRQSRNIALRPWPYMPRVLKRISDSEH